MGNMKMFKIKSNNDTLIGSHHIGNNTKDYVVMIVHGYLSANRIGPYRMYYQIASMLNEFGYDVFRVDFAGCGESTDNCEITLDTFYQNFLDSINYIKNKTSKKIILIGHCLGANLAIYYNSLNKGDIHLVFGISPTPMTIINVAKVFNAEQINKADNNESFERKGLIIHPSFLKGFSKKEDTIEALNRKSDNVMLYIPQNDAYVDIDELAEMAKITNTNYQIIENGDHHFLNKSARDVFYQDMKKRIISSEFNYKHIIFDIDGTMSDTEHTFVKSISNVYKRVTKKDIDDKEIAKLFGMSALQAAKALNVENELEFSKMLIDEFDNVGYPLFEGIKDILNHLKNQNVTLGIITSRDRDLMMHFINQDKLNEIFKYCICVDDVKNIKPNKESIDKYIELSNASKKEIVYIGDKYNDYLFALNSNIDFIYAIWGVKQNKKVDVNKCKFVCKSVKQLGEIVCK